MLAAHSPVREEERLFPLVRGPGDEVFNVRSKAGGGKYTYMVCGCKEHCIPSIEETAKISSLVAPSVYLTKGQKYHIWYDRACMRANLHDFHNTLHDIDTIELQRKHYTRARTHRRKCSTTNNFKNNSTLKSTTTKSSAPTSKLKKCRSSCSRYSSSSLGSNITASRCLTLIAKSLTSSTGTRCPNSSLR